MAVTLINVLAATGYSIAGIIAPQTIIPASSISNEASFSFTLYAAAQTIPLAIVVIYSIDAGSKTSVLLFRVLAGFNKNNWIN